MVLKELTLSNSFYFKMDVSGLERTLIFNSFYCLEGVSGLERNLILTFCTVKMVWWSSKN